MGRSASERSELIIIIPLDLFFSLLFKAIEYNTITNYKYI